MPASETHGDRQWTPLSNSTAGSYPPTGQLNGEVASLAASNVSNATKVLIMGISLHPAAAVNIPGILRIYKTDGVTPTLIMRISANAHTGSNLNLPYYIPLGKKGLEVDGPIAADLAVNFSYFDVTYTIHYRVLARTSS